MTAEDLFGLVVRIAGITFISFALFDSVHVMALLTGLPIPSRYPLLRDITVAECYLAFGLVLFMGAEPITRFAYRHRRNSN